MYSKYKEWKTRVQERGEREGAVKGGWGDVLERRDAFDLMHGRSRMLIDPRIAPQ